MKSTSRTMRFAAVFAAGALALTACSSDDGATPQEPGDDAPAVTEISVATAETPWLGGYQ
jgi:hypothetical protein